MNRKIGKDWLGISPAFLFNSEVTGLAPKPRTCTGGQTEVEPRDWVSDCLPAVGLAEVGPWIDLPCKVLA